MTAGARVGFAVQRYTPVARGYPGSSPGSKLELRHERRLGGRAPRPASFSVSMNNPGNWSRLAQAAADARDELRLLVPALDRAISEEHPDVRFLERVRDVALRNAERLRLNYAWR